jgi:hypothetical protein
MKFKDNLKDWQLANIMFGKNNQAECKIIKKLRKKKFVLIEDYGEGIYSVLFEGEQIESIIFEEMIESFESMV